MPGNLALVRPRTRSQPCAVRVQKAAQRGYVTIVKKLLDAGADWDAMDNNGHTALDWARAYGGRGGDGVKLTVITLEDWEKKHST